MKTFSEYVSERHRIHLKKMRGEKPPWTTDPILQNNFFCCAVRDDDRTSREAAAVVRDERDRRGVRHGVRVASTFRFLNHVDSWKMCLPYLTNPRHVESQLLTLRGNGYKIFGSQAFKLNVQEGLYHVRGTARMMSEAYSEWDTSLSSSAKQQFSYLLSRGVTNFLAYQILQDQCWSGRHEYSDRYNWCYLGPGAVRGLSRLAGTYEHRSRLDRQFVMKGVDLPDNAMPILRELRRELESILGEQATMFEVEHNLCEYDKYVRIYTGESRGKVYKNEQ